jgi:hypothetical protein
VGDGAFFSLLCIIPIHDIKKKIDEVAEKSPQQQLKVTRQ